MSVELAGVGHVTHGVAADHRSSLDSLAASHWTLWNSKENVWKLTWIIQSWNWFDKCYGIAANLHIQVVLLKYFLDVGIQMMHSYRTDKLMDFNHSFKTICISKLSFERTEFVSVWQRWKKLHITNLNIFHEISWLAQSVENVICIFKSGDDINIIKIENLSGDSGILFIFEICFFYSIQFNYSIIIWFQVRAKGPGFESHRLLFFLFSFFLSQLHKNGFNIQLRHKIELIKIFWK